MEELENLCRICLEDLSKKQLNRTSLDETVLFTLQQISKDEKVSDVIFYSFGIKMLTYCGTSNAICDNCLQKVRDSYTFKKQCEHAQQDFEELLLPLDTKLNDSKGETEDAKHINVISTNHEQMDEQSVSTTINLLDTQDLKTQPVRRGRPRKYPKQDLKKRRLNSKSAKQRKFSHAENDELWEPNAEKRKSKRLKRAIIAEYEMQSLKQDLKFEINKKFSIKIKSISKTLKNRSEASCKLSLPSEIDNSSNVLDLEDEVVDEDIEIFNNAVPSDENHVVKMSDTDIECEQNVTQETNTDLELNNSDANEADVTYNMDEPISDEQRAYIETLIDELSSKKATDAEPKKYDRSPKLCYICGVVVKHLHGHMRIHRNPESSERKLNFICAYCKKPFYSKDNVRNHIKSVHEKNYICETCGKKFGDSHHLKVHLRQHTGEHPYQCQLCECSFKQNVLLRRHMSNTHDQSK